MVGSQRVIFILQLALIIALAWAAVYLGRDEIRALLWERGAAAPSTRAADGDGGSEVTVSPAVQLAAGLEVRKLEAQEMQPALPMQGRILELGPLTEARARLQAALAEESALVAAVDRTRAEHRRVVALYQADRTTSQRAVETADSERIAAEARLAEAQGRVAALTQQLRQEWGTEIARWATSTRSPDLERLLGGEEALILMTLAPEHAPPRKPGALDLVLPGVPGSGRRALPVSPAPRADPAFPGATYFFRAPSEGLRAGERVIGRLIIGGPAAEGVMVPESAVVWYGGLAWVYIQEAPDRFERRAVSTGEPIPGGWFDTVLEAGDPVVVRGAQLLLSEEFRGQITNENED